MSQAKKTVILLALTFVLPILLSSGYFYYVKHFGSHSQVNYGTLLDPVIRTKTKDFELHQANGQASAETLAKKWTLTYLNFAPHCTKQCQDTTALLVRLRALMNEDTTRIQVLLMTALPDPGLKVNKKVLLLPQHSQAFAAFSQTHWPQKHNTILLLDPLGNIVLQYPNPDLKKMHRDLSRLLKYSRIG